MAEVGPGCHSWRTQSYGHFLVADGELHVEGCSATYLVERFGSPLHVVSEQLLRRRYQEIEQCFRAAWPEGETRILASIKANYSLALRRILTIEGAGCDTFGTSELTAALACGVRPDWISVNGTGKSAELIGTAVHVGATVTIDGERELGIIIGAARDLDCRAAVRIRLRPDLSGLTEPSDFFPDMSIAAVSSRYKPGVPADDIVEVVQAALASPHVHLLGYHVHMARHSGDLGIWRRMMRAYAQVIGELRDACDGWVPEQIDVGGGFPSPGDVVGLGYSDGSSSGQASRGTIGDYATTVAQTLRTELREWGIDTSGMQLLAEPGRALYADAGVHLTRVLNVKMETTRKPTTWVETDTSEAFLPDVNLEQCRWPCILAGRASKERTQTYDIMGVSCGFDVLAERVALPLVATGDVLAFLFTGAYQDAGAGNFNAMPRPATVLVNGSHAEVVKRAESLTDVFARDIVPSRLGGPVELGLRAAEPGAAEWR